MPRARNRFTTTGLLRRALRTNRAATAVEYGLICACIVIVMVASLHGLAGVTVSLWNSVSTRVVSAN